MEYVGWCHLPAHISWLVQSLEQFSYRQIWLQAQCKVARFLGEQFLHHPQKPSPCLAGKNRHTNDQHVDLHRGSMVRFGNILAHRRPSKAA